MLVCLVLVLSTKPDYLHFLAASWRQATPPLGVRCKKNYTFCTFLSNSWFNLWVFGQRASTSSPPRWRLAAALPFIWVQPLIHPQNSFLNKEPDHWEAASKAPLPKLPSIYSLFPLICYTSTTLGNFYPFQSRLCSFPLLQPTIKGR